MKLLPLLCLVLSGCAATIPIKVETFDQDTRIRVTNVSGQTLHDVKMKTQVYSFLTWYLGGTEELGQWEADEAKDSELTFRRGIDAVEVSGKCREGRFKVRFDPDVRPAE